MGVRFDVPCRLGGFERALSGFVLLLFVKAEPFYGLFDIRPAVRVGLFKAGQRVGSRELVSCEKSWL